MTLSTHLTRRAVMAGLAVLGLIGAHAAKAAPPASVLMEVNFLLGYVEGSGCDFERNGSWHTSVQAQAHLRTKFDYLIRTDAVRTTEQFIDNAASRSQMSGLPYRVRCPRGEPIASGPWLHEELSRMRKRP